MNIKLLLIIAIIPILSVNCAEEDISYLSAGMDWTGLCATGMRQSPIVFPAMRELPFCPAEYKLHLHFHDRFTEFSIQKLGKNWIAKDWADSPANLTAHDVDGLEQTYDLLQFHFHTNAEHKIHYETKGVKRLNIVAHFVFKKRGEPTGDFLAVIEVNFYAKLFRDPPFNPLRNLKLNQIGVRLRLNLRKEFAEISNGNRSYILYKGSLTTPPCLEAVNFYIQRRYVLIGSNFDGVLQDPTGQETFRETQPINNRKICKARSNFSSAR